MKRLILLLFILPALVYSQKNGKICIQNIYYNIVYKGIDNYFYLHNVGQSKNIQAITDNGRISCTDFKKREYTVIPGNKRELTITIIKIKGKDTIKLSSIRCRVKNIEPCVNLIQTNHFRLHTGNVKVDSLKKVKTFEIDPNINNGTICGINLRIIKYTLTIFRQDSVFYNQTFESDSINNSLFNNLQSGDVVIFSQIVIIPHTQINPLEFTID